MLRWSDTVCRHGARRRQSQRARITKSVSSRLHTWRDRAACRLDHRNQGQHSKRRYVRDDHPLDFLARLASLIPSPRVNLTRFHGVFSANHRLRAQVVPGQRGRGDGQAQAPGAGEKGPLPRHVAMTWAQRLARVFKIDVNVCERCGWVSQGPGAPTRGRLVIRPIPTIIRSETYAVVHGLARRGCYEAPSASRTLQSV
jgi:hypothetical protein